MRAASNRKDAAQQFWHDVKELLMHEHRHSEDAAQRGIAGYRSEVKDRKLGEVVFNQGEEQAAKVIDGMIRRRV